MTQQEQRSAIAQACGWSLRTVANYWDCGIYRPDGSRSLVTYSDGDQDHNRTWADCVRDKHFPDYLNDLNEMHEAENNLEKMNKAEFAVQLCRVAGKDWPNGIGGGSFIHIHATAAQRAEAFLKTLNLWTK